MTNVTLGDLTVLCRTESCCCWCRHHTVWWWVTWSSIFFSKSPTIPPQVLLVTYQTESKSFLFLIVFVYCKFLLQKYSHKYVCLCHCACNYILTRIQNCFLLKIWFGSIFHFFLLLFFFFCGLWLFFFSLIPIEISLILLKLTSWQPRHVHFPSLKTGVKQMLPGFPDSEPFQKWCV